MRLLIQRVSEASVRVDREEIASIGQGLLVLVGIEAEDTEQDIDYLTSKLINLRIFDDTDGIMNHSIIDIQGDILLVSQFTLHASTQKGNRPSYIRAARPDFSEPLYARFCAMTSQKMGRPIQKGRFGADMQVSLINNGPVTIWMDSKQKNY